MVRRPLPTWVLRAARAMPWLFGMTLTVIVVLATDRATGPNAIAYVTLTAGAVLTGGFCALMPEPLLRWGGAVSCAVVILFLAATAWTDAGVTLNGARRWLELGGLRFQPCELAKPAVVVVLAMGGGGACPSVWRGARLIAVLSIILMVATQPDIGTALLLWVPFAIWGWGESRHTRRVVISTAVGGTLLALSLPHVRRRLAAFVYAEDDPRGAGFQILQASRAVERAGLFGPGDETSAPFDVPGAETDFAMVDLMASNGAWVGVVICLLVALLAVAWRISLTTTSAVQSRQLIALAGAVLCSQAAINLLSVSGLFPIVGMPLPVVSHGGTALFAVWSLIGLMCRRDSKGGVHGAPK